MNRIIDLLVFGNATEDFIVHPDELLHIKGPELAFLKDGVVKKVRVQGDSIRADEKPRFDGMTIDQVLEGIQSEKQAGGGGLHCAVWLAENGMKPFYLDVSVSSDVISERLSEKGVASSFVVYREVPKNLILDLREFGLGKVVVRGPKLERVELLEYDHLAKLAYLACSAKALLLHTPKDTYVVRHFIKEVPDNTQIMFVFTDSLPRGFVMDELMPRGTAAMSRKGLYKFGEKLGIENSNDSLHYSADIMRALRLRTLSGYPLLAVTEGEGVVCSAWETVYNVSINPDELGKPKEKEKVTTSRAEDIFAAALFYQYLTQAMRHPVDAALSAFISELTHRGYTGARPELFNVHVVSPRSRTIYAGR